MGFADASASERPYLPPAVAVSTVAFALRPPPGASTLDEAARSGDDGTAPATLWIPLVRRTREPFRGRWALPGGPTRWNETLTDTALRSIRAAARCTPGYLEQLYAFGGVERSADAARLVTIAYWAMIGEGDLDAEDAAAAADAADAADGPASRAAASSASPAATTPGTGRRWDDPGDPAPLRQLDDGRPDAEGNVAWCSADRLPELAFDHADIIAYALARLRSKTEYAAVAHRFLGPTFSIGRLRAVHEAVLGAAVDPANFRRQMLARGALVDTGERETGAAHRPARLYRFSNDAAPEPPDARPHSRRSA
ncbi:NUDIX hydrolase [Leucobacter chromiiresistens]